MEPPPFQVIRGATSAESFADSDPSLEDLVLLVRAACIENPLADDLPLSHSHLILFSNLAPIPRPPYRDEDNIVGED